MTAAGRYAVRGKNRAEERYKNEGTKVKSKRGEKERQRKYYRKGRKNRLK
jgi:hypothetical protein